MKKLILQRNGKTTRGTFGTFVYKYLPICLSLELPWLDNEKYISCIPEDLYLVRYVNNKFLFDDKAFDNRTDIQVHTANYLSDIEGCIAPGTSFTMLDDKIAVNSSRLAFTAIVNRMKLKQEEQFLLHIR